MNPPSAWTPRDPDFESRVRCSFDRQGAMRTLGARMGEVAPGRVEVCLDWAAALAQQHGFLHGGVIASVLDSACGYAAMTLMPAGTGVLTIEFKINFLAPARGQRFAMIGEVVKSGRTVSLVDGRAWAHAEGGPRALVATMTATMMTVVARDDVKD